MKHEQQHSAKIQNSFVVRLSLTILFFVFMLPAYAQNTKGDDPRSKAPRESRFKTKPKKEKAQTRGKRISPGRATKGERAWSGDVTGRKVPAARAKKTRPTQNVFPQGRRSVTRPALNDDAQTQADGKPPKRITPRSATGRSRNIFPQSGPYVRKYKAPRSDDSQTRFGTRASSQPRLRSATGSVRNVFPQRGPYVAKTRTPSKTDGRNVFPQRGRYAAKTRTPSRGDGQINWQGSANTRPVIRSVSGRARNVFSQRGPYVAKTRPPGRGDGRINWRGSAVTRPAVRSATGSMRGKGTAASRPVIRSATGSVRNVFSQKGPYVSSASLQPRPSEKPPGKRRRAYPASASKPFIRSKSINPYAGFWNRKQKGEKAFTGDISGKKLRTRDYQTPKLPPAEEKVSPYLGRKRLGDVPYSDKRKGRASLSATRPSQGWQGDISGRKLRTRDLSSKGKLEAGRPLGKLPYTGDPRIGKYAGSMKAKKPLKGGGSVSGQLWNNKEKPLVGRAPKGSALAMGAYQGSIKARKKEPGKEVGGFPGKYKLFDLHPSMRDQGEEFTGYIKAKKPKKGGGSVSGQLWNNKGQPLAGRAPKGRAAEIGSYQGSIKVSRKEPSKEVGGFPGKYRMFDLHPSMRDQGEEFTGYIRRSRLSNDYIRNPNSAKEALKKSRPGKSTFFVDGLQVRVKQQDYRKRPNAADGSMPGIGPGKASVRASEFARGAKRDWNYKRNPSSDEEALKVKEPGKAYARTTDYQGNIKMKKYELFGKKHLHPDAQFVKTNKNNVKEEKTLLTNFKLWWARSFKKSDTQPNNLKEKTRKPRYDKGEQGLWYD